MGEKEGKKHLKVLDVQSRPREQPETCAGFQSNVQRPRKLQGDCVQVST